VPILETLDGQTVETELPELAAPGDADQAPPPRPAGPTAPPPTAPTAPRRRGRPPRQQADKARVAPAPPPSLSDDARRTGVTGLMQLGASATLLASKATEKRNKPASDAFKADAVTLASHADNIAEACIQTAHADPKFAALLDKVCAAGPYGALILAVSGIGAQIVRNHNPDRKVPGTVDPDELLKAQNDMEAAHA
jgi:hypothetical protein